MARERISDIWGGTSSPWADVIRSPLVRRKLAVLVAVPLSAVGFAIADNPSTPAAARLLVAPGYVAAFHLPIYAYNAGFLVNIGRWRHGSPCDKRLLLHFFAAWVDEILVGSQT